MKLLHVGTHLLITRMNDRKILVNNGVKIKSLACTHKYAYIGVLSHFS